MHTALNGAVHVPQLSPENWNIHKNFFASMFNLLHSSTNQ